MAQRDDQVTLREILDNARKAQILGEKHTREDLDEDWVVAYALRTALQIVGEGAGRLSERTTSKYSKTPWGEIVGLRNHLVHGYDHVDLDILWNIVQTDLPPLVQCLEEILTEWASSSDRGKS